MNLVPATSRSHSVRYFQMTRTLLPVLVILSMLTGCGVLPFQIPSQATPSPVTTQPSASPTNQPAIRTATIEPTLAPSPSPYQIEETVVVTPTVWITTDDFSVRYHPDGPLYVGDQVSIEVIAPAGTQDEAQAVKIEVPTAQGTLQTETSPFAEFGLGHRLQATFIWIWDTSGLPAGEHTLTFQVEPLGKSWQETVELLPSEAVLPPEPEAQWVVVESECCRIHYITGTEAERDIQQLQSTADEVAQHVSEQLGTEIQEKVDLAFIPRVLGHGGFTAGEITVSYLDRNYAGSASQVVLQHEMVHLLDGRLEGNLRPTLLVEGLAVYLTGGHFKLEPLMERAAGLLSPAENCEQPAPGGVTATETPSTPGCGLGRWIPLQQLADDFYPAQHEIGYLQAGALVEFMVETWGWDDFSSFYRDITPVEGTDSQAAAIDAALQKHFGLTFNELEDNFVEALRQMPLTPQLVDDVRLSVYYYDTVRRYQEMLDPSAYFLTAWLLNGNEMRQREIVADYLRHPSNAENVALEMLLVSANNAMSEGNYARMEFLLDAVNAVLEVLQQNRAWLPNAE